MQEEVVAVLSARGLLPYLRGDVGSFSYVNSLDAADNWVLKIVKKEIKKKKRHQDFHLAISVKVDL